MLADPTDTTNDDLYLEAADRDDDSILAPLTEQEYADGEPVVRGIATM